jgi:hypothetical protein
MQQNATRSKSPRVSTFVAAACLCVHARVPAMRRPHNATVHTPHGHVAVINKEGSW